MENKISFKSSLKRMAGLIKQSQNIFITAVVMVLIPVVLISCYCAFVLYKDFAIDYSVLDSFDYTSMASWQQDQWNSFYEAYANAVPLMESNFSASDTMLELIAYLLSVFIDIFVILLALNVLVKSRRAETGSMVGQALRKVLPMVIVGIFYNWVGQLAQSFMVSSALSMTIITHIFGSLGLIISLFIGVLQLVLIALLVSWLLLYIYYTSITVCIGRTRLMLSFGYAREILRGRSFRQAMHIIPWVACTFLIPTYLQRAGMFTMKNPEQGLILTGIAAALQIIAGACMWMFLVPEYFELEKQSGIQEKIRSAVEQAMQRARQERKENPAKEKKIEENEDTGDKDQEKEEENESDKNKTDCSNTENWV